MQPLAQNGGNTFAVNGQKTTYTTIADVHVTKFNSQAELDKFVKDNNINLNDGMSNVLNVGDRVKSAGIKTR